LGANFELIGADMLEFERAHNIVSSKSCSFRGQMKDVSPRWSVVVTASSPDEEIEAAQKRALERTRRPILAADIAHFGEDETVIMRREGGWIRVYRAHHKADTMTTVGHIAKAMRDIDAKANKND
jgi:hypothetical protein